MDDVELVVEGVRYGGWKSIQITRSLESIAGSFSLEVSDKWGDGIWPIVEEDACDVLVDGELLIDGYVDKRSISASKELRSMRFDGRDRSAALVDCDVLLSKWTYRDLTLQEFAEIIARPFGVGVSVQPGLTLPKIKKIVVSPGDTAFEAIRKAASDQNVQIISDAGGVFITRTGTRRAPALIEGENVVSASVDYDGSARFYRYTVLTQWGAAGWPEIGGTVGSGTRVKAEAIDEGVRRTERTKVVRPEKGYDLAGARRRADWEARTTAARAEAVAIGVQGWRQPSGRLWTINELSYVSAPTLIGVAGDMLISQVDFSISEAGRVTTLRLIRPDALTPEPKAKVKASGGKWKELDKGAR